MPFLPTLAVAVVLAAASLLCPGPRIVAPEAPAATAARLAAIDAAMPAPTPALPAASAPAAQRPPATLAFATLYPLVMDAPAALPPGIAPAAPRIVAAARRPCRHCQEHLDARRQEPATPRAPDPATARADVEEDGVLPSAALPFVGAVAGTFAPAVRTVRRVAGSAADGAVDLVRGGAASVKGSVALLAECLP